MSRVTDSFVPDAWSYKHLTKVLTKASKTTLTLIRLQPVSCWHDLGPKKKKVFHSRKVNPTDIS